MDNTHFHNLLLFYNTIVAVLATSLTLLGVDKESFTLLAILLLIDYLTGVSKAYRLKESITSNKMKYGIVSKMSLLLIPIVIAIAAKSIHANASSVLFTGINILVLSEVYSIIGNIYSIRSGESLPEIDAVSYIGKALRKKIMLLAGCKDEEDC